MARVIEYTTGKFKIESEVPTQSIHQLHIQDDRVGMFNIGTKKYTNGEMELYSDWLDSTGTPYADLDSLLTDLETKFPFFFDVDGPSIYAEVNTFADLPLPASSPGVTYHVISPTGTWILGTRRQAGLYRSDGVNWILRNDISSLLLDNEFNIRDDVDNTKGIRFVLDALTTGIVRAITWPNKDITVAGLDDLEQPVTEPPAGAYTVLTTDRIVWAQGGDVTLYASASYLRKIDIRNVGNTSFDILPDGVDTIEGEASFTLNPGESLTLSSNKLGSWLVI